MKKPKICFLMTRPEPHRIPLLNLIAKIADADFQVVYCTQNTYQNHRLENLRQDVMPYQFLTAAQWSTDQNNQSVLLFNFNIWKVLDQIQPDLILLGGYSNPTSLFAIFFAWVRKIRYGIINESHLLKQRPGWKEWVKKIILPILFTHAFVNLATGTKAREYLEHYRARRDRIFIFPNTCDVDYFSKKNEEFKNLKSDLREKQGFRKDSLLFIFVGRLVMRKNIEILISAASQLMSKAANIELLIVGGGPLEEKLKENVRGAKMTDRVFFLGSVENKDLPKYYSMADAFVLPSREETWGVVVTEAMACGLPVILSDQVGAGYDLLKEGKNGFWFENENVGSLTKAMEAFFLGKISAQNAGSQSKQIIQNYTYSLGSESLRRVVDLCSNGH